MQLKRAAERAAHEEQMKFAIRRGRAGYAASRITEGTEAAFAKATEMQVRHDWNDPHRWLCLSPVVHPIR